MRARNLKPGLFNNELLGSADPLITILFEGLWCVADREGRLEDRPLRLCAQIFPYRRSVTERKVDAMLDWLHENGFIVRYSGLGKNATGSDQKRNSGKSETRTNGYIQVVEFLKHQNPHKNEAPSKIPALSSIQHGASTGVSTVQAPECSSANTEGAPDKHPSAPASSLNPDSLIPDSSLRDTCEHPTRSNRDESRPPALAGDPLNGHWEEIQRAYPKFSGRQDWISAQHHANQIVERGEATPEQLLQGLERYGAYCRHPEVVTWYHPMTPGKFFSAPDKPWQQEWPPPATKAERQQDENVNAGLEWLRESGAGK